MPRSCETSTVRDATANRRYPAGAAGLEFVCVFGHDGVQLIDATSFWVLLRKSLGTKRREIPFDRKEDVLRLLADFEDGATRKVVQDGEEREVVVSRVYPTTHFGFRKITVERPLKLVCLLFIHPRAPNLLSC